MPTIKEMREFTGDHNGNSRDVLNAILRKHWPGGGVLLDVHASLHQILNSRRTTDVQLEAASNCLNRAADKARDAILADWAGLRAGEGDDINDLIFSDWPGGGDLLDAVAILQDIQDACPQPDNRRQWMLDQLKDAISSIRTAIKRNWQGVDIAPPVSDKAPPIPLAVLGTMPDMQIAMQYNRSHTYIAKLRRQHGIAPYVSRERVDWDKWDRSVLDLEIPASKLAKDIGCHPATVSERRRWLRGEQSTKYRNAAAHTATMGRPRVMPNGDNIIATIRRRTGWSQKELAQKLGVTGGTISRYEKGEYEIMESVKILAQQILGSLR